MRAALEVSHPTSIRCSSPTRIYVSDRMTTGRLGGKRLRGPPSGVRGRGATHGEPVPELAELGSCGVLLVFLCPWTRCPWGNKLPGTAATRPSWYSLRRDRRPPER